MAKCRKWVNTIVITCTNWAESIDYTCTKWADEGSSQCNKWDDEGSSQCSDWDECGWRHPFSCISGLFCKVWNWVAKWVCKAWYWIAKYVCIALAYLVVFTCGAFSLILNKICTAWDYIICSLKGIMGIFINIFNIFTKSEKESPKIEQLFVLMLENRSYDHIFGFSNIEGYDSIKGQLKMANGVDSSVHSNIDPTTGNPVFVRTPADYSLRGIDKDPGHSFGRTLTQLGGNGAQYPDSNTGEYPEINNSGFIQAYLDIGSSTPNRIMDCFSKEQLPVLNKLAEEFAICDSWFSSLPGPTSCNRFFLLAGTSGGLIENPKPRYLSNEDIISGVFGGFKFENGHVFDELDSKCADWLVFAGDKFPNCLLMDGMLYESRPIKGRIKNMDTFQESVNNPNF